MSRAEERDIVFNVVWTGSLFKYLRYFVVSQMEYCDARYRFVANGCPPDQIDEMERFRSKRPDRVVEVFETTESMKSHGFTLDVLRAARDDGPYFSMIDPDILATGPFLQPFVDALERCAAITSGRGVWRDDDVIPVGHPGVSGEYFYSQSGFLFGSPHFAIYHRAPLDATALRWDLKFNESGLDLPEEAAAALASAGHDYFIYDTGKLLNTFLQIDGNQLCHEEHASLMHIGGLSHYLTPPKFVVRGDAEPEPDWARWKGMASRFEVARFTATVLRVLCEGGEPPDVPSGLDDAMTQRLQKVRAALVAMVGRYYAELSRE
jgi:hypothetical protein